MARLSGRSSRWGAFLDSTLDRVGDAAIFGGLLLWFAGRGDQPWLAGVTRWSAWSAAWSSRTPRPRAEGLGLTCDVGIAERSERLVDRRWSRTGLAGLVPRAVDPGRRAVGAGGGHRGHRRPAAASHVHGQAGRRRRHRGRRREGRSDRSTDWAFAAGLERGPAHARAPVAARDLPTRFADQAWLRHGASVQQLERNLRRVVAGRVRRASCASCPAPAMRSYLRYWLEAFRLPDWSAASGSSTRVRRRGRARARRGARRRAAAWCSRCRTWATGTTPAPGSRSRTRPFTTVAERLKPEALYERFVAYRERSAWRCCR